MKCKFFTYKNDKGGMTTVAVSSYAGRKIKGYAKCSPEDTFDEEKGKQLAEARCRIKYSEKRLNRATNRYIEALNALNEAVKKFEEMKVFYMDCVDQMDEAIENLEKISEERENEK